MATMSDVRAKFTATAQGFKRVVGEVRKSAQSLDSSLSDAPKNANKGFNNLWATIGKVGTAYVGFQALTSGLSGLSSATLGANADMETYQNTLTTLMKSSEEAKATLDWAEAFAGTTPFEIPQIVDATAKLTAYGMDAQKVMTDIGNMASIMGKPLDMAVEAVADAQTGELERLKEFGITKQMLIEKSAELYDTEVVNSKGQIVDMKKMNGALFAIMQERYAGGMEIASKSAKGLISNIKDSMGTMMRELSKPMFKKFKSGLQSVAPFMAGFTAMIKGNTEQAMKTWTDAFGAQRATQIKNFINGIKNGFQAFKTWLLSFKPTIMNIVDILGNLAPIGKAIATAFVGIMAILPPVLNVLTGIVSKITAWEGFIPILAGITAGMVAFHTIQKVMYLWNKKMIFITKAWTAVQRIFNLVMKMNPIGLIISLLIGLGVAIYTAYQRSETFRTKVNAVMNAVKTAFQIVWNALGTFFTVTLPMWFNVVKTFFMNIFNAIKIRFLLFKTAFMVLWTTLKNGVLLVVRTFVNFIKTAFFGLVNRIKAIIQPFVTFFINTWRNLKLLVLGIIGAFFSLITGDFEGLKLAILAIVTAIKNQLINIWTLIKTVVTSLVSRLWSMVKAIFNTGKAILFGTINAIKNFMISAFKFAVNTAINTFNWLVDTAVSLFVGMKNGIIDLANRIKNGVINGFNNLKDRAVSAVRNLVSSVKNFFGNLLDSARDTARNFVDSFTNIDLAETGRNIIRGLINGIKNMAGSVYRKAQEIADGIKSKIKKALSIFSPSKDTTQFGEYIGQGLVNGMQNLKRKVIEGAGKLANAIKPPLANVGMGGINSTATIRNIGEMKHVFDLRNVPEHINTEEMKKAIRGALKDPKVQTEIDRVNFINRKRTNKPNGG